MSSNEQQGDASKYTDTSEFALWDKYESVAMHFNELLIRLRTQALGGLAGIVALSGLAINFTQKPESKAQWEILCGTLLFFLMAWIALWILDIFYYNRLLVGAVDAIIEHERRTPECVGKGHKINLSMKINARAPRYTCVINCFYLLVLIGLLIGAFYTGFHAYSWQPTTHEAVEYKVQFPPPDALKILAEPAKPPVAPTNPALSSNHTVPQQEGTQGKPDMSHVSVYLAAPLFTQAEWQWNERIAQSLREQSVDVILPQRRAEPMLKGISIYTNPICFKAGKQTEAAWRRSAIV